MRCSTLAESVELLRLSMPQTDRGVIQNRSARRISRGKTDLVLYCTVQSLLLRSLNQRFLDLMYKFIQSEG